MLLTSARRIMVLGCTVITPDVSRRQNRACILALYYAFCNAICTSSPAAIHCADRLLSFLLFLTSIRMRGPARRSRPTADDLQILSPALQVSSRLSLIASVAELLHGGRYWSSPGHVRPTAPFRSSWPASLGNP